MAGNLREEAFQMNRHEYEIRKDQTRKVFDVLAKMINGDGAVIVI